MARGEVFPIINCADLAGTRRWYERVFSGVLAYRFPDEGDAEYLTLRIGTGQIALGNGTAPALYGEAPLPSTGHAVDLCLYVPDLDAVVAAAAGSVAVAPADMPWGERVAYLSDPEGTMLLVIQDAQSPARSGTQAIEQLKTAECWRLLEESTVGRLAVVGLDGAPDVFPLNYTVHDGSAYARTGRGKKLLDISAHPSVALEIDGEDGDSHWSVVVRGTATRVALDAEIRASGVLRLGSANPASKPHVIRITPVTITGRRLLKRSGGQEQAAPTGESAAPEPAPTESPRAQRPNPIPHHPPHADD